MIPIDDMAKQGEGGVSLLSFVTTRTHGFVHGIIRYAIAGEGERASIGMIMTMAMERELQHPTQTQ